MPTVPAPSQPRALEPLPAARVAVDAPLEAFGGGAANPRLDLSELETQAHSIFEQAKRQADQTAVIKAAGQASDLETRLTIATRQRQGQDAFSAPDEVQTAWEEESAKIEAGLTNDTQRASFQQIKASHARELNVAVQSHVAEQRQKYSAQVTDDYIANERNAAVVNYQDPMRVQLSIDNQSAAIEDHLNQLYHGQIPEGMLDRARLAAASQTHLDVIDRLLANGQDRTAQQYYAQVKNQIAGTDTTKVEKALNVGSTRGESQRQADKILAEQTLTEQEAVAKAREIKDPEVRDATEERIRREYTERAQQAKAQRDGAFQRSSDTLERSRGNVDAINPTDWSQLTLAERSSLRAYGKQLLEGVPTKTDLSTYYSLQKMAVNPATRDKFLKHNLLKERAYLSESDFKSLVELQTGMQKGDQQAEDKLHAIYTNNQIVDSALEAVGLGVKPSNKEKDAPVINVVRRSVQAEVQAIQARTGKAATPEDVQKITDAILTQHIVSTPGFLYGTNQKPKYLWEMTPEDQMVLTVKDIPKAERMALEARMRAAGMPITEQNLVTKYRAYLNGLVRRGPQP